MISDQKLAEIRRELERQEEQASALEASARVHGPLELHIGEEVQEQLDAISTAFARPRTAARAVAPSSFIRA